MTEITYIHKYFPYINKLKRNKLQYDEVGLYSITPPKTAEIITKHILQYFNTNNIIITDGTAGLGGDTLSFANNVSFVISIEYDFERYKHLINNVGLYEYTNVICINEDYLNIFKILTQDVIFLDPPWGGKSYKESENIILTLNNIYIHDLCKIIIDEKLASMTILKLPLNYDITSFNVLNVKYIIEKLQKILLIIIFNEIKSENILNSFT